MNKDFYEKSIEKSKIKQDLIKMAITTLVKEDEKDFDYLQKCFEILREEQNNQKQYEDFLQKEISGENEKRAEAKKRLGIGG